ncbi:MAG TPA: ribosome small subunit-dependent GTPase A [Candidatus Barnesiella excrementigallinarum]|nr:ribosome small subunit-dependent GTPase A [Candidatus Barnesiella excrementigallinarum]
MKGLVTKNTGSWYIVCTEAGESIPCKIKGNFRLKGIRSTNPVSVGDLVDIELNTDHTAFITRIHERKNYIIRRSSNLSKESHIIAANIDQALLIISINSPSTSTTFIDRFLATAEAYRIPVSIVINKCDSFTEEDKEYAQALCYLYRTIGYECRCISATTGEGFDFVTETIKDKITLLSGNSGVGKSTIISRILPGIDIKIGAVSTSHHKGMHTTTFSEMYPLPQGGYIIDTPGIKGFGTIDFDPNEVAHYFPEIFEISQHCRFNNCTHRHEPGCAVLKALENHEISESRYTSYLSIMSDSTEGKYREAF